MISMLNLSLNLRTMTSLFVYVHTLLVADFFVLLLLERLLLHEAPHIRLPCSGRYWQRLKLLCQLARYIFLSSLRKLSLNCNTTAPNMPTATICHSWVGLFFSGICYYMSITATRKACLDVKASLFEGVIILPECKPGFLFQQLLIYWCFLSGMHTVWNHSTSKFNRGLTLKRESWSLWLWRE